MDLSDKEEILKKKNVKKVGICYFDLYFKA